MSLSKTRNFSIVTKTACLIYALICLLIAILTITSRELVLSRFETLEREDGKIQIQRVVDEIASRTNKLKAFCTDWAYWDDTYRFVAGENSSYIANNLMDETFADQKLNFMLFYDAQNNLVYQRFYDFTRKEGKEPDKSTIQAIQSLPQLFARRSEPGAKSDIIITSSAPALVISAPILSSTRKGPLHGTLFVGRYLDSDEVKRMAELTHLNITLKPYIGGTKQSPAGNPGKAQQGYTRFEVVNKNTLVASSTLTDISGLPEVEIIVTLGRAMYQHGYAMWEKHVLSLLLVGFCVTAFLVFLLNRLILRKLVFLAEEVARITNTEDASLRIKVEGGDEISDLGARINSMLDTMQGLQTAQLDHEKYLQNLLDTVNCGIMVVAATGKQEVVAINKVGATMLGKSTEEIIGKKCTQFIANNTSDSDSAAEATNRIGTREVLLVRNDSTQIPVWKSIAEIEHGHEQYLIHSFIDISQLKEVESGLRSSRERYRQFFEEDLTGDYIVSVDGGIIDCNLAYAKMFGYDSIEEIKQTNVVSQYPVASDRDLFVDKIRRNGKLERYKSELRRRDGSPLFCVSNEIGRFDEDGNLIHIWGYLFDETKRVLLERDIRQNQKLEAIGTLAGGIAHDFNNILTGIIGYTELIMLKESTDGTVKDYLHKILAAGGKARALVLKILAFSRETKAVVQPVSLPPVVQEVMGLLRASLPATIVIEENLDFPAMVLADPVQIHQIILNLCTNAGHAMRDNGGSLTIALTEGSPDKELLELEPLSAEKDYVRIRIADTGHGIPEEIINRIFDPFFTTKTKDEGTGLGLSVVHGIITGMQGHIAVNSKVGEGTVFDVYLPLAENVSVPTKSEEPKIVLGKEHIVYIDDESQVLEIGREILRSLGYQVTEFNDGLQALAFLSEHHEETDLIISDLTMPAITGIELARSLRNNNIEVPMIIYTGYEEHLLTCDLTKLGIEEVLLKPVTYQQMSEKVREVLERVKESPNLN